MHLLSEFAIDIKHQRKGFGSLAIPLVLDEIKSLGKYQSVSICYIEGNDMMKPFFEQFGFSVVDQDEFDETIMRLVF
ncbi:hypothetical protein AB7378_19090 [Providencia rettgeri]